MLKKSQIWIETAIYTLIGLTVIAIVLSIANPQIEKIKDKSVVEQTITALNVLDSRILDISQSSPGNIRIIDFKIAKGRLEIDSESNQIVYTLENTRLELTQAGLKQEIREGNVLIKTESQGRKYKITLRLNYPNLDLTSNNEKKLVSLTASSTPYKIQIENVGDNQISQRTHVDFALI